MKKNCTTNQCNLGQKKTKNMTIPVREFLESFGPSGKDDANWRVFAGERKKNRKKGRENSNGFSSDSSLADNLAETLAETLAKKTAKTL